MDYLKRLQEEVDHIASLCDEAALLQAKLAAAVNRLDNLELERKGMLPVSLQEMRDMDGVDYQNWDDFIRQTGPYEPTDWGGHEDPDSVKKQKNARRTAARRWERDLGLPGIYPLVLEALVAAHHLDPNSVQLPASVSSENEQACRLLFTLDMARGDLGLALPLPTEVERATYYPKVRRLIVEALKSRYEVNQNELFILSFYNNKTLVNLLGKDTLDRLLTDYTISHRVAGYIDCSENSLSELRSAFAQKRDELYWNGFREPEIDAAISEAVLAVTSGHWPALHEVRKLVDVVANNKRLRGLLEDGYRTTDDWYRRQSRKI